MDVPPPACFAVVDLLRPRTMLAPKRRKVFCKGSVLPPRVNATKTAFFCSCRYDESFTTSRHVCPDYSSCTEPRPTQCVTV